MDVHVITLRRGDVQLEGRADEVLAAEGDRHLVRALHWRQVLHHKHTVWRRKKLHVSSFFPL